MAHNQLKAAQSQHHEKAPAAPCSNCIGVSKLTRTTSNVNGLLPFGASQCVSEGLAVDERQGNHVWPVISSLQEHELRLRRYVKSPAAPLRRHPPELATRARQESVASELQSTLTLSMTVHG